MNAQPFKPFRICLSDGKTYDIVNHDMAWVKSITIEIGIELDDAGLAVHTAECALFHITRVEDIATAQAA
jgi:hypothetical protein